MRIFPIAKIRLLDQFHHDALRKGGLAAFAGKPLADHSIVSRRVIESLHRQPPARALAELAVRLDFRGHGGVVARIHHHAHAFVVLGRRPDHGRTAYIDLLNNLGPRGACARGGFGERVQIDHRQRDRTNTVCCDIVGVLIGAAQQGPVNGRMQGLHTPAQHLGRAGYGGDFLHRKTGATQQLGGAAGGHQIPAGIGKSRGELARAGLVRNAEKRPGPHQGLETVAAQLGA